MHILIKAATEAALAALGYMDPEVKEDGSIVAHGGKSCFQVKDAIVIAEVAVMADLIVEAVTGQRPSFGEELVKGFADKGWVEGGKGAYYSLRHLLMRHEMVTPDLIRDALTRCVTIVPDTKPLGEVYPT